MIKTLSNTIKQDKEKFVIPKKVQDVIPVRTIWPDGIFLVGKNKYSRMYRFSDVNYACASKDEKTGIFLDYSELLNSLDSGSTTKLTINNRRINRKDFEERILMEMSLDGLDGYREEYNSMLLDKAAGSDAIIQDKFFTISVNRRSIDDARLYFARVGSELSSHLSRLGSTCTELSAEERLRVIHDFMRTGEEASYHFDLNEHMRTGHDFRDYICPDSYENHSDHFMLGSRYGRVLLLRDYAAYIRDDMLSELTGISRNLMLSIDVVPVPTDEAVKEVEQRLLGVETNVASWQRKQNMNNNFSAVVPYDMEQQRRETKEFLDDLTTRDQRMMFAVMTLVHTADTKEQLDNDTEEILTIARKHLCQMAVLRYQQLDGLMTALPYGVRRIDAFRTLTTESLAVLIIADRRKLLNGNSFILGVSGGGKSFMAKTEITSLMLSTDADILILDPEREYSPLVRALGGSVIEISANSANHINAMDMSSDYGESDPVIEKSQFLQSLCEQIIAGHRFQKGQQSIIDRCTENVYRFYRQGNFRGMPPTLVDFREELLRQPEPEAHALALELELFTRGSLNTFAKQTNVDTSNRLICYDILELGEQLRAIGMLIILDSILNRITRNRQKGKQTFVFIDELYLLFMHEYSAQFLYKLWKRVRKYGAFCTGITQNVLDLLQSTTARTMLSNSEFIIMLNQAATDRIELAKLLNISDQQLSYITNVEAGHGLMKIGSSLIPFENEFPENTKLYRLMTTKPAESIIEQRRISPFSAGDREVILDRIREIAKDREQYNELVEEFLYPDMDAGGTQVLTNRNNR